MGSINAERIAMINKQGKEVYNLGPVENFDLGKFSSNSLDYEVDGGEVFLIYIPDENNDPVDCALKNCKK